MKNSSARTSGVRPMRRKVTTAAATMKMPMRLPTTRAVRLVSFSLILASSALESPSFGSGGLSALRRDSMELTASIRSVPMRSTREKRAGSVPAFFRKGRIASASNSIWRRSSSGERGRPRPRTGLAMRGSAPLTMRMLCAVNRRCDIP